MRSIDIGYRQEASIMLLPDGQDTSEIDPLARARLVSVAGVRIVTVGIGTRMSQLVRAAGPRRGARHLPVTAMLLGLTALGIGAARPTVKMTAPQNRTSIIVARRNQCGRLQRQG